MHDTRCSGFVGGDPGAITVPNFFQHFSPDVIGASVGSHFLEWAGWVSSLVVFAPSLCLRAVLLTLGCVGGGANCRRITSLSRTVSTPRRATPARSTFRANSSA
jgi:hypothetical protein